MTTLAEVAAKVEATIPERMSVEKLRKVSSKLTPMEHDAQVRVWAMRWPVISLEFLRMRDKDGFPRFAVFTPESNWCIFSGNFWKGSISRGAMWGNGLSLELQRLSASLVQEYFGDIVKRMKTESKCGLFTGIGGGITCCISQQFNGVIPDSVREQMSVCAEIVPGRTIVVSEATPWKVSTRPHPALSDPDPLVIRVVDGNPAEALLVAHFDATKAEEYVMREFSEA